MGNLRCGTTPWSIIEDETLCIAVTFATLIYGKMIWIEVSHFLFNRTAAQCRKRWSDFFDPRFNFESWTHEEDTCLVGLVTNLPHQKQRSNTFWLGVTKQLGTKRSSHWC